MLWPQIRHIAVVAPAGPMNGETLAAGVAALEALGKQVTVMPHVLKCDALPYLAASAAARAADLTAAWLDPGVDLVLAARGGFGSAHLLPLLDWEALRRRDLPLVGYSDITALLFAFDRFGAGRPVVAPMAGKFAEAWAEEATRRELIDLFAPEAGPRRISPALTVLRPGELRGRPLAANLAVAASLCGTPYLPSGAGRIIILEDLNEPPYKVDRYLTQLEQSGFFRDCAGILFGGFLDCGEPEVLSRLFARALAWTAGPVGGGFPFGHAFPLTSLDFRRELLLNLK